MRTMVNDNFNTIRSTHAGEAFPTENLVFGMKCFRTDEKKTYTLVSIDPLEWAVEASGGDIVNAQKYLAFVGREALGRLTDWSGLFNRALSIEVVDFAEMFRDCHRLRGLNLITWDTSKAIAMGGMFRSCGNSPVAHEGSGDFAAVHVIPLKLDLSAFDLSNVETTSHMFAYARCQLTIGGSPPFVEQIRRLFQ